MMDGYWGHGTGNGYDVWGFVFRILMMTLVILSIVFLVRYLNHATGHTPSNDTALDILKTRYAKGEIDKKEFDEKRKDLND